jgi:hypothetical protein
LFDVADAFHVVTVRILEADVITVGVLWNNGIVPNVGELGVTQDIDVDGTSLVRIGSSGGFRGEIGLCLIVRLVLRPQL